MKNGNKILCVVVVVTIISVMAKVIYDLVIWDILHLNFEHLQENKKRG